MSTRRHARKHEALLSLSSRLILLRSHQISSTGKSTPVTFEDIGFFSRDFQRHLLFHAGLTWLGPSRPFCSRNIGWWAFSLEQVGIFLKYQMTYLLPGRMKVPHLISVGAMEFDHVYCMAILAGGHTSDSHLAIQFVDYS